MFLCAIFQQSIYNYFIKTLIIYTKAQSKIFNVNNFKLFILLSNYFWRKSDQRQLISIKLFNRLIIKIIKRIKNLRIYLVLIQHFIKEHKFYLYKPSILKYLGTKQLNYIWSYQNLPACLVFWTLATTQNAPKSNSDSSIDVCNRLNSTLNQDFNLFSLQQQKTTVVLIINYANISLCKIHNRK